MRMKLSTPQARSESGFTLIELLVTLLVVTVGLLGLAKLQAAAISETQVARTRSLMTFQAEALAGVMRSNHAYWQTGIAPYPGFSVAAGGAVTDNANTLAVISPRPPGCVLPAICSAAQLAYDDVHSWAESFGTQFPTGTAAVVCVGTAAAPVTCDITLTWSEHYVAINRTTAAAASANAVTPTSMVLHIQP